LRAALAAAAQLGVPLTVVSAAGAGVHAGAGWWAAMVEAARPTFPSVHLTAVLDCGDQPGHVLAAWRAGVADVRFSGEGPAADRLDAIAVSLGRRLWRELPPSIELRFRRDPVATARNWLVPDGETDHAALQRSGSSANQAPDPATGHVKTRKKP